MFIYYLISVFLGSNMDYFMKKANILTLQEGVDHYEEAHYSKWNCYMHTIGMPFTVYGLALFLPALFKLTYKKAIIFRTSVLLFYLAHYVYIDLYIGFLTYILFSLAAIRANYTYNEKRRYWMLMKGFLISFSALSFQEYFGHYLGGDIASRAESVPNAIMYAMYFSVYHIFH
jgi:uncharacterized membrane protein YGL010W